VHRHDRQRPSAEQSDGSATGAIHLGWVAWSQVSYFQWDCMMPDTTIQWSPARSNVHYTPQADGTLAGVMHTEILSGPCQGTVEMNMTAQRT
jgi:hypothetical protein